MANTVTYNRHDYVVKLRQRLNKPTTFNSVMNVIYSDSRTIVNSILSTEPASVSLTRGTAYTYQDFTLTADTLTISTGRVLPILVDEADRYQQTYFRQMEIADYQGKKINEFLESEVLAQHASWRDFGVGDLNFTSVNDATTITVSATNIDNIIRSVTRKIYTNNGVDAAVENGIFFVWRPRDWEFLTEFAQANGFSEADIALKNGMSPKRAISYLGAEHYLSNDHTALHLFAGVKKVGKDLGILRSTFGRVKFIEEPGLVSGLGLVSRADYGFAFPTAGPSGQALLDMSVDINVA